LYSVPPGVIVTDQTTITQLERKLEKLEHTDRVLERRLHGMKVRMTLPPPQSTYTPPPTPATTSQVSSPSISSSSSPPSWWVSDAMCVHSHEGTWTDDTGNGYYGGMQFSASSWLANGGGQYAALASEASPSEQLQVAYNYWRVAGWSPWPNTSAMCGL
jgi:resuscitation-promoting factor RpfB